jgi:dethiobiotin synthetase
MGKGGIFITGTDTGVGKTVVAATLARTLRRMGLSVGVMKPVTSGCRLEGDRLVSDDARLLAWAAESTLSASLVSPYLLRDPIAPAEAAARDGVRVSFDALQQTFDEIDSQSDFTIVEGAGGLMVPLAGGLLVSDLAARLGLPLLVVSRPALGTVNHTLLTTFAARQMGLDVRGIIINGFPDPPGLAEETAPHLLDTLSGVPILGIFPEVMSNDPKVVVTALSDRLLTLPTTSILWKEIGLHGR